MRLNGGPRDVIKGEIIPESVITPYVRYGDYLLRIGQH